MLTAIAVSLRRCGSMSSKFFISDVNMTHINVEDVNYSSDIGEPSQRDMQAKVFRCIFNDAWQMFYALFGSHWIHHRLVITSISLNCFMFQSTRRFPALKSLVEESSAVRAAR